MLRSSLFFFFMLLIILPLNSAEALTYMFMNCHGINDVAIQIAVSHGFSQNVLFFRIYLR